MRWLLIIALLQQPVYYRATVQSMHRSGTAYHFHVASATPSHQWDIVCPANIASQLAVGTSYSVTDITEEGELRLMFYLGTVIHADGKVMDKWVTCNIADEK